MPCRVYSVWLGQGYPCPLPGHIVQREPGLRAPVHLGGFAQRSCRSLVPTTVSPRKRYSKIRSTECEIRCQINCITRHQERGEPGRRFRTDGSPLDTGQSARTRGRCTAQMCLSLTFPKAQPRSGTDGAADYRPRRWPSAVSFALREDSCLRHEFLEAS